MKEKKFFCDRYDDPLSKKGTVMTDIVTVLFLVVVWFLSYKVMSYIYIDEINSYPEEKYSYLEEVVTLVVANGDINLGTIPDDVTYLLNANNGNISFVLSMEKDNFYEPELNVTVNLSENFEVINSERNSASSKEFTTTCRNILIVCSMCCSIISMIIILFLLVILSAACSISKENKKQFLEEKLV